MIKGGKRKALIVGISEYASLQKLDFCKKDGQEVYSILSSLGYEISENNKLIGEVKGEKIKDIIYDFFDDTITALMIHYFSIILAMEYLILMEIHILHHLI